MKRFITVCDGKRIPLGVYVAGIKKVKSLPLDTTYPHGLTCWWQCTGAEILSQFRESIQERINDSMPYIHRRG